MIRHIVLLDLSPEYDRAELSDVMTGLGELQSRLAGFSGFEHGRNINFEGMSEECAYVIICHFDNEDVFRNFIIDPVHADLGQRLVNICRRGVKGISIIDVKLAS